jgi:hypothetical protein
MATFLLTVTKMDHKQMFSTVSTLHTDKRKGETKIVHQSSQEKLNRLFMFTVDGRRVGLYGPERSSAQLN